MFHLVDDQSGLDEHVDGPGQRGQREQQLHDDQRQHDLHHPAVQQLKRVNHTKNHLGFNIFSQVR